MPHPRSPAFDSSLDLLRDGNAFILKQCRRLEAPIFRTRLAMRPVICITGEAAARRFYDGQSFTRAGAMPPTTVRLLQDKGSVQALDGPAHRNRKAMFLDLLTGGAIEQVVAAFDRCWDDAVADWHRRGRIILHEEATRLFCDLACQWAGVPQAGDALDRRVEEMDAMIENAGSFGPQLVRALMLRRRSERWAGAEIRRMRHDAARRPDAPASPAMQVALFRDRDVPLTIEAAAVELLNLVRPLTAVARYVTFAAHALAVFPEAARWLCQDIDARTPAFVQELRRFYPFLPFIGGRVTQPFMLYDTMFRVGQWVILGLHATNRDAGLWERADTFDPRRFDAAAIPGIGPIPQGAGAPEDDHRCPGETMTIALTEQAVRRLARLDYHVPSQTLDLPMGELPTLPSSHMIIDLQPAAAPA